MATPRNGRRNSSRKDSVTSLTPRAGGQTTPRSKQNMTPRSGTVTTSARGTLDTTLEEAERGPMKNDGIQKCDMCDAVKQMVTRCMDCNSNMCNECSHYHTKMKITQSHDVVDYKKYYYNPPPAPPRSKIFCDQHRKEKYTFYCKVCMKPVCRNCKLTKHEGHITRELKDEIEEQRELLPAKLSQIRSSYLPLLRQQLKEADEYQQEYGHSVKATVDHIERRNKTMKDEADRSRGKIVGRLKDKDGKETARIVDRKNMLTKYIKSTQSALNSGDRVAEVGDDFDIIDAYLKLQGVIRTLQEIVKRKPTKTRFKFEGGPMNSATMETLFGNYTDRAPYVRAPPRVKQPPVASLQIVPEIQPALRYIIKCTNTQGNKVSAIAPVGDGEAWVCFGWSSSEIYLYNKSGFKKNRLKLKGPVDDITVDHSGNLIISTFAGSSIRQVDKKLKETELMSAPLIPRGLTISSNGEIIACAVDTCSATPPPTKSSLLRITSKGNLLTSIDGDKSKRIPIHPFRVSENIDGSLCVADLLSDRMGRVVVLNSDGKVRMVYTGYKSDDTPFLPYGICTDKYGHILVGDIINKEVHLLNTKGYFVRVLLTTSMLDGERPYSLAIDTMGHLWVGNERKTMKVFIYYGNSAHFKR